MTEEVRQFSAEGIQAFSAWLKAGARGMISRDLLHDSHFAILMSERAIPPPVRFDNRYQFGNYLRQLLAQFDSRAISYNRELWAWLAARHFDEICPATNDGVRKLREEQAYIPSEGRKYYRHLVRTPWFIVRTHGVAGDFLLAHVQPDDPAPLSRQSYLLDQLAARQFVITSPTLIAAARKLYTNPSTGLPRTRLGRAGGSPRRLAIIANQLSLTYDIRNMPVEHFLRLLPREFSQRQ